MSSSLSVGAKAPFFNLPAVNLARCISLADYAGRRLVLILLPPLLSDALGASLAGYSQIEQTTRFAELMTDVVAISAAAPDKAQTLVHQASVCFPLLSDPSLQCLGAYVEPASDPKALPVVYLIDEMGVVRAAYDVSNNAGLPSPTAVARAVRRLNAPKPLPASIEDWRLGPDDAAVAIIEYSDYQCEHCMKLHRVMKYLEGAFPGQLLIVHRHLPLRYSHPLAQQASEAAEAAGAQGKFWAMHDSLFGAQGALEREHLILYAREIGLDVVKFALELDSHRYQEAVNDDFKRAVDLGIKRPPTVFINGIVWEETYTEEEMEARIRSLLTDLRTG